jgi:hypothetical protein
MISELSSFYLTYADNLQTERTELQFSLFLDVTCCPATGKWRNLFELNTLPDSLKLDMHLQVHRSSKIEYLRKYTQHFIYLSH